uniref:Uncharacterized protein n=1 Tax=Alexandrium andersonii TaxID=327968 RepID=A0A7S2F0X7_9DINO|mmetsp:Transcript_12994/g.29455  ORF Transcript_12994/g.29455 Transcript_12994/m.29455 type:complete len:779 (+) Transcript_12994:128-2464(+)
MASHSMKASRKGRNLCNYSGSGLGWKGSTRRNTYIGKDCAQNRMCSESYMRNSNYDGRPPPEVKKCTTLSRAIAVEEGRRKNEPPCLRARPGYLGAEADQGPEESARPSLVSPITPENQTTKAAGGRCTWIDTREKQTPPQQNRATQESPTLSPPQEQQQQQQQRPAPEPAQPRPSQQLLVKPAEGAKADKEEVPRALKETARRSGNVELHRGSQQPKQPQQHSPSKAEPSSPSHEQPDKRHAVQAKLGGSGAQSQPAIVISSPHRATSPVGSSERSSPRLHPGSEPGCRPLVGEGNSFMRFSTASTKSPRAGSSVYSDNLDTSRMSQGWSATLSGSQFGGSGERLDPKKWSSAATDRSKKKPVPPGYAHDELIVLDQLRKKRDEAEGAQREELDKQLLTLLHERRLGSSAVASSRPMCAAFTDRTLRKREGMGSRAVMTTEDGGNEPASNADCGCAVCKPHLVSPAGSASHSIHMSLQPYVHREDTTPSSPQAPRQKGERQGRRSPGSPNFNSERMGLAIKAAALPEPGELQADFVDQRSLAIQMGIKAKSRSHSADPTTAGRYRRKPDIYLESSPPYRTRLEGCFDPSARREVAMILSPRVSDPPLPTRITDCRKGNGEHKFMVSEHAEKVSVHWNQPLYRYEVASCKETEGPSRCASLPSSNFVSFPRHGEGSPRRGEEFEGCAGNYTPSGWGQGGRRSPRPHEGCEVAQATNHSLLAEEAARTRAERMASDPHFTSLCAFTQASFEGQGRELHEVKERYTTIQAQKMASILAWD